MLAIETLRARSFSAQQRQHLFDYALDSCA